MTSARKIKSNRANAQVSTGPRTVHGKARAAQNARRHGLSLSVISDPVLSEQVEALAREIAGDATDDDIYQLARRIAEAQIDLCRVRDARYQFLSHELNDPYYDSGANVRKKAAIIRDLLRPNTPEIPMADQKFLNATSQGSHKFATILSEAKELLAMDRYERRALLRRKFAIRAFDTARR
jgi:protein-tyrosine-phosphatase